MSGHRRKLAGNFISLSFVQGLSIIFPLIIFPFLLRMLGVEGFGIFTLIQTFIMYFDLLISFGFGLTATQQISRSIDDIQNTKKIVAAVYLIKIVLFVFSLVVFLACSIFIPYLQAHLELLWISSLYLLGNLLFPDWYFQGIQKMRNITLVAFISKIISLILIILLVKGPHDIGYAVMAMSVGNLVGGLTAFIIMARVLSQVVRPERGLVLSMFKESGFVFTSIILAPLYSSVNIFILQAFTNPLMVGYYAIADKVTGAVGMLTNIANRTFYPHLSQLYVTSMEAYKKNVQSILRLLFGGFLILSILQFFAAGEIVRLLMGKNNTTDIAYPKQILQIMSIALFFSPYVSFFFQLLILQGQKKMAARNIIITIFTNLTAACLLVNLYEAKGLAVNACITVCTIGFLNYSAFKKHRPHSIQS